MKRLSLLAYQRSNVGPIDGRGLVSRMLFVLSYQLRPAQSTPRERLKERSMSLTSQAPTQPESYDDYPLMRAGPDSPYRAETYNLWTYDPTHQIGLNAWFGASGGDFSNF